MRHAPVAEGCMRQWRRRRAHAGSGAAPARVGGRTRAQCGAPPAAEHALTPPPLPPPRQEIFFSKGGWVIPARERNLIDSISAGAATYGAQPCARRFSHARRALACCRPPPSCRRPRPARARGARRHLSPSPPPGEIQPEGIDRLLDLLELDPSSTFCDLGSGIGRVVLHAAMQTAVGSAVGLELSDSRLEQAEAAAAVLSGLGVRMRPVQFVRADLGSCDLAAATGGGASHYFMCSTAFGAALCRSLAERAAAAPGFRLLVASRPLPPQQALVKVGEVPGVRYSWIASGSLHVYARDWASAPRGVLARFWCRDGVCWAPPGGGAPLRLGLVVPDEPVMMALGGSGGGGCGLPIDAALQQPQPPPQTEQQPQPQPGDGDGDGGSGGRGGGGGSAAA
jgi:SAM-dependent methyltransferase